MTGSPSEMVQEMVQRIVERYHPDRVILFGSCARNEAGATSDVDLLVLFPFVDSKYQREAEIYRLLWDVPVSVDVIVSTSERFERFRDVPNTVFWPAARDGKILYDRAA